MRGAAGFDLSVRWINERSERLAVERGVLLPIGMVVDQGVMVTAYCRDAVGQVGIGYAASADLTAAGMQQAAARACEWAAISARLGLFGSLSLPSASADVLRYANRAAQQTWPREPVLRHLQAESAAMKTDDSVVNWGASALLTQRTQSTLWNGELVAEQQFGFVEMQFDVAVQHDGIVQSRSAGGRYNGVNRQGGLESLEQMIGPGLGGRLTLQAKQLAQAPNCPSGTMPLLLAPDQMMLQIHESIGHPLELDRILGDERNFAGTSFVTLDMFGSYRYGSPLLNVSFDPGVVGALASCAADDDGTPAQREMLIEDGILKRPLGAPLSQRRAAQLGFELGAVANARACGWHRPTIDRMGNINVEPGTSTEAQLIGSIERGILMRTNTSWSIDDSRNKFQFGCEWGQLIENGELTTVVRNPNYRGVSASFWRNLAAVGDAASLQVHGTPFCGKGEPGQVIRVGHAAPMCLFDGVQVFGAAS